MKYQEFIELVTEDVKSQVEKGTEVTLHQVVKNNGITLDAISILRENYGTAPNIYLNAYYEQYQNGRELESISSEIMMLYHNIQVQPQIDLSRLEQFEGIRSNIIYRLVNYKKNKEILKDTPHIRFVDLAIIFYCLVDKDEEGIGSFRISNELAEKWNVSSQQLMKQAQRNMQKIFPPKLTTMEELLSGMLESDMNQMFQNYEDILEPEQIREDTENMVSRILEEMRENRTVEMFVLTNQMGINGAGTILYPDILKNFAELCGSDLYLLPSSIHEFIIVPKYEFIRKEELTQMVREVNESQVAPEEILSDHVYEYCMEQDCIIV